MTAMVGPSPNLQYMAQHPSWFTLISYYAIHHCILICSNVHWWLVCITCNGSVVLLLTGLSH